MGTNRTRKPPPEYIIVSISKKASDSRTDGEGNDITETSSSQDFPSATAPTTETMGDKPKLKVVPVTTKISRSGPALYLHKCDECPEVFPGAERLHRHKLSHASLRCPWTGCYESFDHRDLLEGHLRRHEEYDDAEVTDTLFAANMRQASTRSMPEMRATPSLQTQAAHFTPQPHLEQIGDEHGYPSIHSKSLWDEYASMPSMEISASRESSQSVSSAANTLEHRAKEARKRILEHARLTSLAPKPASQIPKSTYKRTKYTRVFCDKCQDYPEGFRGEHELRRHVLSHHKNGVTKYVCRDPATVGLVSNVEPFLPLSNCKACCTGKQYGAFYNAAAHLRRTHFKPKIPRGKSKKKNIDEIRGGNGGGGWPSMADLRLWFTEIIVLEGPQDSDTEEYQSPPDVKAEEFTIPTYGFSSAEVGGNGLMELFPTVGSTHHMLTTPPPIFSSISQNAKHSVEAKPGVPFTDSGYGSILNPNYPTVDARPEATAEGAAHDTHQDDAMTIYSAATTVTPHHAQQYISEFCDDLHSKSKHMDSKSWEIVFKRLPELIKAFALRLGQESSSATGRNIMYFLHKRHHEIAKHLELVVLGAGGDATESPKADTKGMSLVDKMNMWNERANEGDEIADRDDCFVGVYDVDDEDIGQEDTSVYNETILNSAAYHWFIATIQKEQRIDRGGMDDRAVIDEIRKMIISRLPTACISKRRPAPSSDIAFRLPWWQLKPRLEVEQTRLGLSLGQCLPHAITITGTSKGAQASTIGNYMSQTWPMSNAILLSALEYAIDNDQGSVYHAQLLDKTIIRVHIQGPYLHVAVRGPAQSIAECGEQLAWLAAGLSPSQVFSHCTSAITENDYDCSWIDFSLGCKVTTFDVALQQSNIESKLSKAPCLARAVGNPSIVTGFPIARQPENFFGLEIDKELMPSIIKITDEGFIWPGCGKRLETFGQTDGVVLWHICHSASRPCLCCMSHCSPYPRGFFPIDKLSSCRHIFYLCSDSSHPLAEGQLWASTTKDSISTLMMENQAEQDGNNAYLKDASLSCGSPHLRMSTDSTDTSFESDLFSDSGSSEAFEPLNINDEHFPALNRVLQTLLSGFRQSCQVQKRPGQSETSSGTGSETFRPLRAAVLTDLPSNSCRKRQRQQSDDEGSGNEDMPPPNKRAALPQGNRRRQQQLACPFWKRNPGQHQACFSKTLRRIRDVKQHLTRRHTPEFYCECCCATFENEDSHRRHVTHVSGEVCVYDPTVVLDGISHQQHRRLSKKSDFRLSDQEQWFSVWDILFPGSQRPVSAYLDLDLSEEIGGFKEYCFQYGPATLEQALADEIPEIERRQHLIRICQDGYNQLFEAWYSSRDSRDTSSRNGSSSTSQSGTRPPQCQPTPSSSLDNSFLTIENPAIVDLQSQYPIPNPVMDMRPSDPWTDASQQAQLTLGAIASGDLQTFDQGLVDMDPSMPLKSWSGAGETETGQLIYDPTACSSAMLNLSDLQIDGRMDFNSFLNYEGDTNPNQ